MTRVTYNEYLDKRTPVWIDAEMLGRVLVDKQEKLVEIRDYDIERVFATRS